MKRDATGEIKLVNVIKLCSFRWVTTLHRVARGRMTT
jgi:hypothetical protein